MLRIAQLTECAAAGAVDEAAAGVAEAVAPLYGEPAADLGASVNAVAVRLVAPSHC